MRKVPIVTNQIYHIFNRGVNKADIFFKEDDYRRFYSAAVHYKTSNARFSNEKKIPSDPVSLQPSSLKEVKVRYWLTVLCRTTFISL